MKKDDGFDALGDDRSLCVESIHAPEDSVAKYIVTDAGGDTGLCTGTLLADQDPTSPKFRFLTANHCFSSQAEANTLELYWFFQRAWTSVYVDQR